MRRVTFDYANTCPRIDAAIRQAESLISEHMSELLEEASPLLSKETHHKIIDERAQSLYRALEDIFEETRSANVDMRAEAERQIEALTDRISDLEHDLEQAP